jgi:hypothetical protein
MNENPYVKALIPLPKSEQRSYPPYRYFNSGSKFGRTGNVSFAEAKLLWKIQRKTRHLVPELDWKQIGTPEFFVKCMLKG